MKKKNFQKKILVMACVWCVWVGCEEKVSVKNIFVCVKSFSVQSYPSQILCVPARPESRAQKARF